MEKAWDNEKQHFGQSYEERDVLDSSVLIMPLVFFMQAVSRITLLYFLCIETAFSRTRVSSARCGRFLSLLKGGD